MSKEIEKASSGHGSPLKLLFDKSATPVQNKMHWAVHGQTAAEVIAARADAAKPNMGRTSWKGSRLGSDDVTIAKNYLTKVELEALNLKE